MITWFDALLVTLLAVISALGARRGLAGLAWGLGTVACAFLINLLSLGALVGSLVALVLGGTLAFAISRLVHEPQDKPWYLLLGAFGGLSVGGVLICALALNFPIEIKRVGQKAEGLYPSTALATPLHDAVSNSIIQTSLSKVWTADRATKLLLIPDQVSEQEK